MRRPQSIFATTQATGYGTARELDTFSQKQTQIQIQTEKEFITSLFRHCFSLFLFTDLFLNATKATDQSNQKNLGALAEGCLSAGHTSNSLKKELLIQFKETLKANQLNENPNTSQGFKLRENDYYAAMATAIQTLLQSKIPQVSSSAHP